MEYPELAKYNRAVFDRRRDRLFDHCPNVHRVQTASPENRETLYFEKSVNCQWRIEKS